MYAASGTASVVPAPSGTLKGCCDAFCQSASESGDEAYGGSGDKGVDE